MKNKKIVELMLILGVTAGLAGGCTQKTKEQSYVNITKTAAENSTEQSQEYLYDENGNQYHYIKTEGYEVREICNDRQFQDEKALYDGKSMQTTVYSVANSFGEKKYQVTYLDIQKLFMEDENVKEISYTVEKYTGGFVCKRRGRKTADVIS